MNERDLILDEKTGPEFFQKCLLDQVRDSMSDSCETFLALTQSPIERLMLVALSRELFSYSSSIRLWHDEVGSDLTLIVNRPTDEEFVICPQAKIGKFTVDFVIDHTYTTFLRVDGADGQTALKPISRKVSLIVECDGHDFHEKTKDQVRRDKQRDRALKLSGNEVFRFAGSEIWADAAKCARQVSEFFESKELL